MKRIAYPEGQSHLWPADVVELHTGKPCHPAPPPPLPALPFERNEEIDTKRAAHILGVHRGTVARMIREKLLPGTYQISTDKRGCPAHRIRHAAIVEYCDNLRLKYHLPPRRPHTGKRPPDADILPFPLADTITIQDAENALGYTSRATIVKLFDSGSLLAYQLTKWSPWRIQRQSLVDYLLRLRREAGVE